MKTPRSGNARSNPEHSVIPGLHRPNCDFCEIRGVIKPAEYDAKTIDGPWAYMCQVDYDLKAAYSTLEPGKGQRLVGGDNAEAG